MYVIPMTANCSTEDGHSGYPKHVEILNKPKIIELHLVGYSYTYLEYDAPNHEPKTGYSFQYRTKLEDLFTGKSK
jgi:hypothetical protein